jgi:hypothetical protein
MVEQVDEKKKLERARLLTKQAFKENAYEFDDSISPFNGNPLEAKTISDIIKCLEAGTADIEANVIGVNKESQVSNRKIGKAEFLEAAKQDTTSLKFRESMDTFAYDNDMPSSSVGSDFIPLLGGPFNKQQYMKDYLKGHSTAFYYYHHDPFANAVINMTRDFTLGRGFSVNFKNKTAQAMWDAFAEVNNLHEVMDNIAAEMAIYGEVMLWWLPNKQTYIAYNVAQGQMPPKGVLPRFRLIDPSVIWEIVTYPEDISRVLYYQWVAPTQYQIYTGRDKDRDVPSTKFIFQQIPAEQVDHFKINVVSNEKRGRSDLYPCFGYFKRLRDSVNYSIISMQKNAAWAIDTSIDGDQTDIDSYVASQEAMGTIPPAGSEFVHSTKVVRTHLASSSAGGKGGMPAFDWALSCIASGTGFPISYFGTHLSGTSTRASAIVSTEPIAKKIEKRQMVYERIVKIMAKRLLEPLGITDVPEVTFPQVISQDSSAMLKDIAGAQMQGWISKERAAEMAAKELNITTFNWQEEQEKMSSEPNTGNSLTNPLTTPSMSSVGSSPSAVTSDERKSISDSNGY